ncbi:MAG: TetR/AcrR family transcriptional regulator [Nakamurella sp.]
MSIPKSSTSSGAPAGDGEPGRQPRNTVRQREAGAASRAETRRRLLVAAAELFGEKGYQRATVNGIASRAGVSLQTLYLSWGSKRELLRGFLQYSLSGSPTAITDSGWAARLRELVAAEMDRRPDDPTVELRAAARVFRHAAERAALAWQLYRDAAAIDSEIADDWAALARLRRQSAADGLIAGVLRSGSMRPTLDRDAALDTIMVVMGPESYDVLVRQAGYTLDRYEQWLGDTLIAALLPDDGQRAHNPVAGDREPIERVPTI